MLSKRLLQAADPGSAEGHLILFPHVILHVHLPPVKLLLLLLLLHNALIYNDRDGCWLAV